jgi:hypothetical protein
MKQEGWNKYWIRSLDRDELTRIITYDARNESPLVKEMIREACRTCPNQTRDELDILNEDIEL